MRARGSERCENRRGEVRAVWGKGWVGRVEGRVGGRH